MKSLFITIIICSLSFIAKSQETTPEQSENDTYYYNENHKQSNQKNQYIREAGKYLQKHSKQYYIGVGIMGGGYLLAVASISNDSEELAAIGSLFILGGFVVQIISHRQIGKAGDMLERSTLSKRFEFRGASEGMGLGLAYNF